MNAYIIGVGMIRFSKYPNRNVRDMAIEATLLSLKDCELEKKGPASSIFFKHFLGDVF